MTITHTPDRRKAKTSLPLWAQDGRLPTRRRASGEDANYHQTEVKECEKKHLRPNPQIIILASRKAQIIIEKAFSERLNEMVFAPNKYELIALACLWKQTVNRVGFCNTRDAIMLWKERQVYRILTRYIPKIQIFKLDIWNLNPDDLFEDSKEVKK